MKKKLFSAICAFVISISQCGMAFATDNPVEIEEINIVDEAVSEEINEIGEGAVLDDSSAPADTAPIDEDIQEDDTLLVSDAQESETTIVEDTVKIEETEEKEVKKEEEEEEEEIIIPEEMSVAEIKKASGGAAALDMRYRYRTSSYGASSATYSQVKTFGFSEENLTYNIFLPDNTQYAYLDIDYPTGATLEVYTINGENPDLLGVQELSAISNYQYKMKNPVLTETIEDIPYYIIPVKNEYGTISVTYTLDTVEKEFKINFYARQPRLTAFTQYADTNISFVSGAAANNDNGTIIDSAADSTVIRALSNISRKLVGSSVFMLPISKMKVSNSWFIKNRNGAMFDFTADHAGTVYIMSYLQNTANFNSENGWTTVNNGTTGTGITISATSSVARTKNDYTNTDYFAGMYGWKCKNNADFSGANLNRINRLTSSLTSSYVDSNSTRTLKYVYAKSFSAGDTVTIPVPNEINTSWYGMAVLVSWDADIDESVISFTEDDIPGNAVFRVLYSNNGTEYTKIRNDDYDSDNSYTVNFENNIEFAYIKLKLPEGTSAVVSLESNSTEALSETGGYYLIPIRDGIENAIITYTDEGANTTIYSVTFTSPQYNAEIKMKYASSANISFIRGTGITADGCLFSTEYNVVDKIESRLTASSALLGASVFILPLEDMRKASDWTASNLDVDMFSFLPDADGVVYVLTDSEALINSEYELIWDVESGLSGALVTKKTDLQSGAQRSDTVNLKYVYSYEFAKNEEVFIPVPEVDEWQGNMAVVIKWK